MEMHFKKTTYVGIIGVIMVMGAIPLLSLAQTEPEESVKGSGPGMPSQTKTEIII